MYVDSTETKWYNSVHTIDQKIKSKSNLSLFKTPTIMQGALTCGQVEGQCNVLSCGVCQQIFPGHQHSQELHAHACAPDWEEVAIVVGLQETESGCFYLFVSETIKQIRN